MRLTILSLAVAGVAVGASTVHAGDYHSARGDDVGMVTAESRYGPREIAAPVRRGRYGLEVRLPGGSWVDCRDSCSEVLRRETIDFWENHGSTRSSPGNDGPGYFLWRR